MHQLFSTQSHTNTILTRSIWKMLGPFATRAAARPFSMCCYRYCRVPPAHRCPRRRRVTGDRYGPMEWAQWHESDCRSACFGRDWSYSRYESVLAVLLGGVPAGACFHPSCAGRTASKRDDRPAVVGVGQQVSIRPSRYNNCANADHSQNSWSARYNQLLCWLFSRLSCLVLRYHTTEYLRCI